MKLDNMLNAQVKELYEHGNLDTLQIAEVLSLDEQNVKIILMGSSSKFRKDAKKNKSLFTPSDLDLAKQKMTGLIFSELDNVAFRAAKFIINENLGRHDNKNIQNLNININLLNEQMNNARKAIQNGKEKVIDVPSEVSHLAE